MPIVRIHANAGDQPDPMRWLSIRPGRPGFVAIDLTHLGAPTDDPSSVREVEIPFEYLTSALSSEAVRATSEGAFLTLRRRADFLKVEYQGPGDRAPHAAEIPIGPLEIEIRNLSA